MEKEYINLFNKIFNTDLDIVKEKFKVIDSIYDSLEKEIYILEDNTPKFIKADYSNFEKLEKTLNKEQKTLLNDFMSDYNSENAYFERKLFIFAFLVANELNKEITEKPYKE